jgi:hypothetical protein
MHVRILYELDTCIARSRGIESIGYVIIHGRIKDPMFYVDIYLHVPHDFCLA